MAYRWTCRGCHRGEWTTVSIVGAEIIGIAIHGNARGSIGRGLPTMAETMYITLTPHSQDTLTETEDKAQYSFKGSCHVRETGCKIEL